MTLHAHMLSYEWAYGVHASQTFRARVPIVFHRFQGELYLDGFLDQDEVFWFNNSL